MSNKILILILLLFVSCGEKEIPTRNVEVTDGLHYNYILYPKRDSLRYYTTDKDTFKVSMIFERISKGYPLPDIVTNIDNALSEYSQNLLYVPQQFSGDNILNPLGWNFSKKQLFNVAHYSETLAFLQTDGWVELEFNGYKIEYWAEQFESYGIAGVSIDRGAETMVDLYAPENTNNSRLVFVADSLNNDTTHVIRVRYTHQRNPNANSSNARINLDKFTYYVRQGNYNASPSGPKPATQQYEPEQ